MKKLFKSYDLTLWCILVLPVSALIHDMNNVLIKISPFKQQCTSHAAFTFTQQLLQSTHFLFFKSDLQEGFFGLQGGRGCQPCGCIQSTSVPESCDEAGRCRCLEGVAGDKCDRCSWGYYGYHGNGCTGKGTMLLYSLCLTRRDLMK